MSVAFAFVLLLAATAQVGGPGARNTPDPRVAAGSTGEVAKTPGAARPAADRDDPVSDDPLVDVAAVIPDARLDLRYATPANFMGRQVYPDGARCLLRRSVAERLARVQARLRKQGFGVRLWDCYRPRSVQWEMWRILPKPGLVADPRKGSNHNRGTAVDLTLVRADGSAVDMPTDFDSFTPEARRDATQGISPEARRHRELLQHAMTAEGFTTIRLEWWHFNAPGARRHAVLDVPLVEGTAKDVDAAATPRRKE